MCPSSKYCTKKRRSNIKNCNQQRQHDQVQPEKQLRAQRTRFAIFLKILLRRLAEDPNEAFALRNVKQVIQYHSRQLRSQQLESSVSSSSSSSLLPKGRFRTYCPTVESMEEPIRALVGELHWIRAHKIMRHIIKN